MNNKNMKPISHRILVMHSRAITQLVEIRNRRHGRKFTNMAAILRCAHRAGTAHQKGLPA